MTDEWFNNLEDLIRWEMAVNKGANTSFTKGYLVKICEKYCLNSFSEKMTKSEMTEEIIKKVGIERLYNDYKNEAFGIKLGKWKNKFNLTPSQLDKMAKCGFIKFAYKKHEKVFTGTYADVKYFEAKEYFDYTVEQVEKWKEDNIRGYKKRKVEKNMVKYD